jgi:hypothetical protein
VEHCRQFKQDLVKEPGWRASVSGFDSAINAAQQEITRLEGVLEDQAKAISELDGQKKELTKQYQEILRRYGQ